jgi:hypothetical protein
MAGAGFEEDVDHNDEFIPALEDKIELDMIDELVSRHL